MLERDLRDYLFDHPELLFPDQQIQEKHKEYSAKGDGLYRRIDLLFVVEGIRYIVELKRDTIQREDVGQVMEYYSLLRKRFESSALRMILVAPHIPEMRRIALEDYQIRCVEIPAVEPSQILDQGIKEQSRSQRFKQSSEQAIQALLPRNLESIRWPDLEPPSDPVALALSHRILSDGLPAVIRAFNEYEVMPIKMRTPSPQDVLCLPKTSDWKHGCDALRAGAWWAYRFGPNEHMPKNDVPNISVNALPWGLDVGLNAETLPSQKRMIQRLHANLIHVGGQLDRVTSSWQAWLKIEHQPQIYHWIPIFNRPADLDSTRALLDLHAKTEGTYGDVRASAIQEVATANSSLTDKQRGHIERANKSLNLAIRLVHTVAPSDVFWTIPYEPQIARLTDLYSGFKSLHDIFQ